MMSERDPAACVFSSFFIFHAGSTGTGTILDLFMHLDSTLLYYTVAKPALFLYGLGNLTA